MLSDWQPVFLRVQLPKYEVTAPNHNYNIDLRALCLGTLDPYGNSNGNT